jgi:Resolvase, N terminal domain
MMDGVHIIERIHARGAMIKVLDKPHLDLTTPIGRGFIAFLSALAEDERQRIVKPANDGRAAARKRGVHMGRKPKLTDLQRRVARERVGKGESARAIAREWGVAHTTVARAVVVCGTQPRQTCALAGTAGASNAEHHSAWPQRTFFPVNPKPCRKSRRQAMSALGTQREC